MSTTPAWLLGGHLTSVIVTGITVAADGTLTEASGSGIRTITFKVNSVKNSLSQHIEEISSVNSFPDNEVPIGQGSGIDLELILASAANRNDFADLCNGYSYLKCVFLSGAGANAKTWTHKGPWKDLDDGIVSKGKNLARVTVGQMGLVGEANPTYT